MSKTYCNRNRHDNKKSKSKIVISVDGIHCADCALNIERSLEHISGVLEANVSYLSYKATVYYDPYRVDEKRIRKAIEKPGYLVRDTVVDKTATFLGRNKNRLLTSIVGTLLLAAWFCRWFKFGYFVVPNFLQIGTLFSISVIVIGGYSIFKNAIKTLLSFDLNVNVLVSVAAVGAIILGDYIEAATVLFIMVLGEFLEEFTVAKTRRAISSLIEITPKYAIIKREDGEIKIPIDKVKKGDIVVVKSGERIPVDGVVISGNGSVNQAPITGESMPIEKVKGNDVFSGTVNEIGSFEMEATKVGDDTTIAHIRRLIEEAESEKAPIQRITDKYARYFVPIIFLISAIVYFTTKDVERAITILIVACPCALVLGTPTAVVAGIGSAAKRGILIKGGAYLEMAGRLDTVLMDKTGTLTRGMPEFIDVRAFDECKENEVLKLAAIAEKRSEHPLAAAIMRRTEQKGINTPEPDRFEVLRGKGVIAEWNNKRIILGNQNLLSDERLEIPGDIRDYIGKREMEGKTVLLLAHDSRICGVITVADRLKEGAHVAVKSIRSTGIKKIAILTGDNWLTAKAIAESVGIDEFFAEMMPEEKLDKVKELMKDRYRVAMVGDGINDAPALAIADIGIAMGAAGTDVAIETADIALMTDDLKKVSQVIRLSRKALSIIKQNLAFAVGFNFAMITITSLGWITMIIGAVLHQVSSLMVILNSMRLLSYRERNR